MASNFEFLKTYWPDMAQLGQAAELYLYADANACIYKIGLLAERAAQVICAIEKLELPEQTTFADRVRALKHADLLPKRIDDLFYTLRRARNDAVHLGLDSRDQASALLGMVFHLCCWLMEVYGDWSFHAPAFIPPEDTTRKPDYLELLKAQDERINALSAAVEEIRTAASEATRDDRAEKADQAAKELPEADEGQPGIPNAPMRLDAPVLPIINYAMQQNGAVVVQSVTIENRTDNLLEHLDLHITASPEFALPYQRHIDCLPPRQSVTFTRPKLILNGEFLAAMTEKVTGVLHFQLRKNEVELLSEHAETTVLAFDEWHGVGLYPELLAAFVTPNHPQLAQVIARAADHLGKWTGDTSMDGYQSQDPNRVLSQAAAIFTALKEESISYVVPPASFEQQGQRVRLCDMVLRQKLGTCLDLTLLYASCLEAVGLHPLLIVTEGHIFTGLWLEERMFPECVQDDVSLLRKRLAAGVNEIAVVETTCLTSGKDLSFDQARTAGEQNLQTQPLECIIDVHRARLSRVHPLPQRIATPSGWVVRQEAECSRETMTAPRKLDETIVPDQAVPEQSLPKKVQWERKLLDLGLRNTLINLRPTRTQLPILTNSLDELENALSDGSDFSILPRPSDWQVSEFSFEALHELGPAGIIKAEFDNKRLRSILTEQELGKRLKDLYRSARTSLEENGANTLYLALGMLRWFESKRSTKARYAPIVLLPIEMVRRSAAQGYVIRLRDEEPQMNVTLLEKLKQDMSITIKGLDPLPTDDRGVDIRRVLTVVRKAIMDQPHWDVLETASLGIFSFSQFVMWNDIRNRTEDLMRNKVVRSLMEGKLSWEAQPLTIGDRVPEDQVLLPMPADASQLHAIECACAGESFVLHGPPGTGKSQTITSLIANALAQGKRVLFVAEKMAALEVVQKRLDAIGIGPFCLELHSNKSKKKDVLEQLRRVSEVTRTQTAEEYARKADQIAAMRSDLDAYARKLHRQLPCGSTLYTLINDYEAVKDAPELSPFDPVFLRTLTGEDLDRHRLVLERLMAAAREIGHPHGHPLTRVGCTQYTQTLRSSLRPAVEGYLAQIKKLEPAIGSLADALGEATPGSFDEVQRLLDIAAQMRCWYDIPASWTAAEAPEEYLDGVSRLASHSAQASTLEIQLLDTFDPGILSLNGRELLEEYNQTAAKWFLPKLLGTNRLAKLLGTHARAPISKDRLPEYLTTLRDLQEERSRADALEQYSRDLGDAPDWAVISALADRARSASRALYRLTGSHTLLRTHCGKPQLRGTIEGLDQASAEFLSAKRTMDELLVIVPNREQHWLNGEATLCSDILNHADVLKEWIAYRSAADEAGRLGLGNVLEQYAAGMDHDSMYPAYQKALLQGLIREAIDGSGTLNQFSGAVFNKKIEQYKRLDREYTTLSQQEIYCRLAAKVPDFTREAAHSSELGILQRAIKSGGRGVSIRRLFDQIPNILSRLCPCMLMSPISAAQYLDPKAEPFDIVVFDEASQMPTCKAVGVLARGTDAVIVGDPKQMPPTSFFSTNAVDEDNLEAEDLESILDDCLALNMPQSHLLWHYRSRHESLIAFSNSQFYENKLFTFPSVNDRVSKVTLRHVDGVFDRGRSRTNRAEALAVLDEIRRRSRDPELSKQSLGIVTFNVSQQHLIDDLLGEACAKDPALEKWVYGSEEPLFIKNLENVQGDERDVILFSIGFGPDPSGKLSMNFGPLNRDGGWRRLNVAVSRARCEMMVFCTMKPDQLDLNRTKSEGVAALRKFLEYAAGRSQALGEGALRHRQDPEGIAQAICAGLKEAGYDTDLRVGRSEYRLDIGVIDPKDPDQYLLGILLDGPGYGTAKTTRDRELAQISVLQGLGWNILRVWSMDWWDNRDKELQRILKVLKDIPEKPKTEPEPVKEEPVRIAQTVTKAPAPEPVRIPRAPLYRPAVLPLKLLTAEEFLEPRYIRLLEQRIESVIRAEAPVSIGMLTRRVVQSFGIARAGSRIQSHMDKLLGRMGLRTTLQEGCLFFWDSTQTPETHPGFRVSGEGDSRRDIRDVPVQEAANAMYTVLYEQVSMSREDLLRETANKLGYTRLGTNVVSAMNQAISYAQSQGAVTTGTNGTIILSRGGTARAEAVLKTLG